MSIFLPYSPTDVITYFTSLFTIDLSSLTAFESLLITIISNLYFYIFWLFIIIIAYKIFNHLYERLF